MMKPFIILAILISSNICFAKQKIDLISASFCELQQGRLSRCQFKNTTLTTSNTLSSIPVRTVIESIKSGDCSTTNALKMLKINIPGNPEPEEFSYLAKKKLILRSITRKPIASISISDASPPIPSSFPASCRVHLEISFNEPDVYEKKDAEDLIYSIKYRLEEKILERDRYAELVKLSGTYYSLLAIVNDFYTELNNDSVMTIRNNIGQLAVLIFSCSPVLSDDERIALVNLYEASAALGDSGEYKDDNGNTLSLEAFLAKRYPTMSSDILFYLNEIKNKLDNSKVKGYTAALKTVKAEVIKLENELLSAQKELASCLKLGQCFNP